MITQDKIKIYRRYEGDIDSWARSGSKKEQNALTDNDWYLIDSLIQDLSLAKKGLTSSQFNTALDIKLKEKCDSEESINSLRKLADIQS